MGCCHYDRGVSDQPPPVEARIPVQLAAAVEAPVRLASETNVGERLRDGDASLWGPEGTPEIANRLGWLTIAERMGAELGALESLVTEVQSEGIAHVLLLGMGGSSLAPEVLRRTFPERAGHPQLHVLDSTDSATIRSIESAVDLRRTLFIVSSKSGGTIEPLSLFAHFHALVDDGAHYIAITDPGSGLAQLAEQHGFRATFSGDPNIGGRYSALSAFRDRSRRAARHRPTPRCCERRRRGLADAPRTTQRRRLPLRPPRPVSGSAPRSARWHRAGATSSPS